MRVLVVALGSAGDVHPFLALGDRLMARGHDVTLFANEVFRAEVESRGLAFAAAGDEATWRRMTSDPDVWHPRRGPLEVLAETAAHLAEGVDRLREHVVAGETVLVGSSLALAARLVAEADRVPLATVHLAPAVLRSAHRPPRLLGVPVPPAAPRWVHRAVFRLADRLIGRVLDAPLAAERRRLGLSPVRRPLDRWWHSPDLVIGFFPPWFAPPQPDWPPQLRLTGFPLHDDSAFHRPDAELDAWLAAGEPPLVFTAGSANFHAAAFFATAGAVGERLGRRCLLLTRASDSLPAKLPPGSTARSWAPFARLLPRAAALVHHGGIGTAAQALAAGIPQLVVAFAHDQLDNGTRVADLGVGAVTTARRFRPRRAAGELVRLLASPRVAARCAELARRLSSGDAVGRSCDLIESLVD
ncbi:MAG TPA: nucleotide disphospho-sugar-binding domain-containing protein [Thermoanaerobaculia bacterium]|nr:nucleotide disphospho-sugar-binding domain-containing protein [Thermoanaerobaculia bacterium]